MNPSFLEEKARLIDAELRHVFPRRGVPNLNDAVWYHLESGGKRLRPALAIAACSALGCSEKKILPFAAACELMHNWCLPRDTKIFTNPHGPKNIAEIKEGEMVYTFNKNTRSISKNKVLKVMKTGRRPIYEIRTRNRKLSATGEHPILVCERKPIVFAEIENHEEFKKAFINSQYSIRELANELGIKEYTITHWIYNSIPIQLSILPLLSEKLGCDIKYRISRSKRYEYSLKWKTVSQLIGGDLLVISTNLIDDGKPYRLIKSGNFKLTNKGIEMLSKFRPFKKNDLKEFGIPYKKLHAIMRGKGTASLDVLKKIFNFHKITLKEEFYKFKGIISDLKYPANTTENFCQIVGFFIGDGFISNNLICFSQPEGKVRDAYIRLFKKVFGRNLNKNKANECQLSCYSKPLSQLFRSLDLCHRAEEKKVPDWVFTLPTSQKLAFLRGYLDSDGMINKQGIMRFACSSKELIERLKILLDSLGFPTGNIGFFKVKNRFKNSIKKESLIWRIHISNSKKILNEMGTENEEYRKRLSRFKKKFNKFYYGIPENIIDRRFFGFNPVVSITMKGEEEVFNLEVEENNNFIADNVVVHNCLVHDDIMDSDRMRRNHPAVWVKYGLAHGVNVGDYMAQKVYELILLSKECGVSDEKVFRLVKAMIDASVRTAEGQAMDMNLRGKIPAEKEYIRMVTGKTAHYMTLPIVGAAIVAGRDDLIKKIVEFGSYAGPAFQITDDILDLTEGKGRGEIGRDIKEGKASMLVVHCLSRCNVAEKKRLLKILRKPPEETGSSDVGYARQVFEKHGSVGYAKQRAEALAAKAKTVAMSMPEELREILEFFADYLVKRKK